ncbi:MAG: hypothetical protein ACKPJJ_16655, partial [Planctomycetaceae bacterium]
MLRSNSLVSRIFDRVFRVSDRRHSLRRPAFTEKLEQRLLLVGDINGQIWVDSIANGRNDAGERSLAGWPVFIDSSGDGLLT